MVVVAPPRSAQTPRNPGPAWPDPELDHHYYTWARYLHAQLGRFCSRDPSGYARGVFNCFEYAASSPTRRTDALGRTSIDHCNEIVRQTMREVTPWVDEMEEKGCVLPYVLCTDCANHPDECEPGTGGRFVPSDNTIYICVGPNCSAASYRRTLIHEYRHAYDTCMGRDLAHNCRQLACSEVRAYLDSGGCDVGGAFRQPGESTESCVRRKALGSVQGAGCTEADLNAVFEYCYFFLETLPRVPPAESMREFLLRKCRESCINQFKSGELDPEGVEECIAQCESEYGPK